ncbi:MAG: transposase, partial [Flavobacteriales bacterium]
MLETWVRHQILRFAARSCNKQRTAYRQEGSTPFTVSRYQAINCTTCPLNGACHKSKGNRIIEVNHRLRQLKAK